MTVSEIARLADVRPSAVSNWRRRAPDFPPVISRGPTGDLFDRDQVEHWLSRRRTRHPNPPAGTWSIQSIGDIEPYDDAIKVALDLLYLTASAPDLIATAPADPADELAVSVKIRSAIARAEAAGHGAISPSTRLLTNPELAASVWVWLQRALAGAKGDERGPRRDRVAELFDGLLDLRGHRHLRALNESRTAPWAAELVVALAEADHGLVFDPAVGEAGFLLEAHKAAAGSVELIGWEHDPGTLRIAQQRLFVHDVTADLRHADSLGEAGIEQVGADAVVCDAPFGLRQDAARWSPTDARWGFGLPAPIADLGWVELAIHHLRRRGRAAVLLPAASLFRGGSEARIRVGLLRAGVVEAVVALPAGTALHTDTPVALWLLRAAADERARQVLLIDAANQPIDTPRHPPHSAHRDPDMQELKRRILETVRAWRSSRRRLTPAPGFAATVDVARLVEADADLVPARWVTSPASVEEIARTIEAAARDHAQARALLEARPRLAVPVKPGGPAPQRRRIRELIADNRLKIIPGTRIPETDDNGEGTRVLGPWDFRRQGERFTAVTTGLPRTERDDIVIMPAGGTFEAFVDTEGGHLLASPLQAIRITAPTEGSELLHPRLLAAFVSRPDATTVTSGTAGRASVKDIDIPLLDGDTARRLAEILDALDTDERLARDATAAAAEFRRSLLNAANAGWRVADNPQ